jgi:hypothetical protein
MITSWSPSRYSKYTQCPRQARYEIVQKLCPMCFKGKLSGGFGSPVSCDTCHKTVAEAAPLKRGSEIGKNIEEFVIGKVAKLHPEVKHPGVVKIIKGWRTRFKSGAVKMEEQITLDNKWSPVSKFTRGVWFRGRLDVVEFVKRVAKVTDVKTGGIDKKTGMIRADKKYDDQLSSYAVSALAQYPTVDEVEVSLLFTDCPDEHNPVVERASINLTRKNLPIRQAAWEKKVKAMLSDRVFAPRASDACRYCPFSTSKGGPCPH